MQDLTDTQGLGHTNSKQPIQYHLRLKNELEEMRSECVGLLKERFHLEQCIRCPRPFFIALFSPECISAGACKPAWFPRRLLQVSPPR